ncbi:PucR family transcriptional regulator [Nocardia higoensis]|uniref:PucR family transcriptional regulator n=1 Tax=Nocardia higoensis TaxID=228599 RepID=UPI000304F23F|nr:helix-turn-helix domain-containing protein [Nocardia higoensis]
MVAAARSAGQRPNPGGLSGQERSGRDPALLEIVANIARRLEERQNSIAEAIAARIAHDIDQLAVDRQLIELLGDSVHGNVSTILHVLANDIPIENLHPPTAAVEYARRLAQREVPSHSLIRAYHVGHDGMIRIWLDEINALDLPGSEATTVFQYMADPLYAFIDWITQYVFEAYEDERRCSFRTPGSVHSSTIHALLTGEGIDSAGFEAEARYRLDQHHVAVIAWSTRSADSDLGLLDRTVHELARKLAAESAPITTPIDRSTVWAWLPFGRRKPELDTPALTHALPEDSGIRVAFGLPAAGRAGFRRSHEQARAAYTVAGIPNARARPISTFGDRGVAVLSLLTENLDATRDWAREVLGPLAVDTAHAEALRATLHTYLENGESYLRTAESMDLHPNTVKYRIRRIREVSADETRTRLDTLLALQVCELLGRTVLVPAPNGRSR